MDPSPAYPARRSGRPRDDRRQHPRRRRHSARRLRRPLNRSHQERTMTAFVLVFAPVFTALFGLLFSAVVALRPPGLPLSVRVPQSHADDPVVLSAIRLFRWALVLAWFVTAVVALVLALVGQAALAVVVPVLLYAAL